MEQLFDYVVLISSEKELRLKRKQESGNFTSEEFNGREENQIEEDEKKKQADFIFTNNGTLQELKTKAKILIYVLNGLLKK
jgi:dephospho-CoA kinase